jgi:hypothetical protein
MNNGRVSRFTRVGLILDLVTGIFNISQLIQSETADKLMLFTIFG